MYISDLFFDITEYVVNDFPYDNLSVSYQSDTPFFSISVVEDGKVNTYSIYLTPNQNTHNSQQSTLTNFVFCSNLLALFLKNSKPKITPASTEYGYSNGFGISNMGITIIISVVANQEDAAFIFTSLKNKIQILCKETN